jgi:hypothetical protein
MKVIIYLIILVYIIKKVKKHKEENSKQKPVQPNQPRQQVRPNQASQQVRPNQARQQELKQRLQKQYENVVNKYLTPIIEDGKQQDDIMGRVHANVAEYAGNQIEQEGKQDNIPVTEGHIDYCLTEDEDCSLMDRVYDLMIMGYQADLTFERDFVAEGIAMLNSYKL